MFENDIEIRNGDIIAFSDELYNPYLVIAGETNRLILIKLVEPYEKHEWEYQELKDMLKRGECIKLDLELSFRNSGTNNSYTFTMQTQLQNGLEKVTILFGFPKLSSLNSNIREIYMKGYWVVEHETIPGCVLIYKDDRLLNSIIMGNYYTVTEIENFKQIINECLGKLKQGGL